MQVTIGMLCASERWVLLRAVSTWPLPAFPNPLWPLQSACPPCSSRVQSRTWVQRLSLWWWESTRALVTPVTTMVSFFVDLRREGDCHSKWHLAISSLYSVPFNYASNCWQARMGWWGQVLAGLQAAGKIRDRFSWVLCCVCWSKQDSVILEEGTVPQVIQNE